MTRSLRVLVGCCSILHSWSTHAFAAEPPEPTEPISYQDIGKKYHIEGEFGLLFTDFTIKGVVVEPPAKRYKDEDGKTVWLDITHLNGKVLEPARTTVKVYSDSKFLVGSKVELELREEGELWKAEGIDAVVSSPDRSHLGKVLCKLSIHQRRLVSNTPPQ